MAFPEVRAPWRALVVKTIVSKRGGDINLP
jgi:hypothetical protein